MRDNTYKLRTFSLILCFVMLFSLSVNILAYGDTKAVVSTQNLSVNGKKVDCVKYNINGYNYFKLRDIAYLLNDTKAQFEVIWDKNTNSINITTGKSYNAVGGELEQNMNALNSSVTAKVSSQILNIDGKKVSNLSVYNINGNNYFKLRDLGSALNFKVDFDDKTNTAIIDTGDSVLATNLVGFNNFDSNVITYVENHGFKNKNYMVSPTSFRAALALAILGAKGQTQSDLLALTDFNNVIELEQWYKYILKNIDSFNEDLEKEKEMVKGSYASGEVDRAFSIANSIWNNINTAGTFNPNYVDRVSESMRAIAKNVTADEITKAVNNWVNEETHGMIPQISSDLSESASVLANALYLRTTWVNPFEKYSTKEDTFTTYDGKKVQKDFMHVTDVFRYYEDEDTKLIIVPMKGDIYSVFVIGSNENIADKIAKASADRVKISLPKFEIDTAIEEILVSFLRENGAEIALTNRADFSFMCEDSNWCISNIIQKSKIKVDEEGIEASAATIIETKNTAIAEPIKVEKEFNANEPFLFYLYMELEDGNEEMLFFGRYVE